MNNRPSLWEGDGLLNFSRGFYPEPFEITLVILVFAFFLCFLIISTVLQVRRERSGRKRTDDYRYLSTSRRFSFSPGEEKLLSEMLTYLPSGTAKADLLTRQEIFRYCEEKTVLGSPFPPMRTLASLRVKLGFTAYRAGREIRSTSEIPPGAKLYFENQNSLRFAGILVRVRPKDFVTRVSEGALPPLGAPLDATFTTREGRYAFTTFVVYTESPYAYFEHAVIRDHVQQRRFYRRELFFPVLIRAPGRPPRELKTTLIEISGGGCSVVNIDGVLSTGAHVELFLEKLHTFTLTGTVIRISRNTGVAHIAFQIRREPDRDRLIRFIRQAG